MKSHESHTEDVSFRTPELSDGAAVYELVKRSPPLDLNSRYSYLILCDHFSETCIVAEHRSQVVGFISAYPHPKKSDTLFVWQVVVAGEMRGRGLAGTMLDRLSSREASRASFVETTVTPSNQPSLRFFQSFADARGAELHRRSYLAEDLFGDDAHEEEILLRIGPLNGPDSTDSYIKEKP